MSDASHIQPLVQGNIWESFFREKKKERKEKDCFKTTNKLSEHAKLVGLVYI